MTEEGLEPLPPDSCDYIISTTSLAREAQDMKWFNVGAPASGLLPRPSSQHLPCMRSGLLGGEERGRGVLEWAGAPFLCTCPGVLFSRQGMVWLEG